MAQACSEYDCECIFARDKTLPNGVNETEVEVSFRVNTDWYGARTRYNQGISAENAKLGLDDRWILVIGTAL